jgi:hypothetical protein
MILLVQASGMMAMGGPSAATKMIANEQRLLSFVDAIIRVSPSIIDDLSFLELTNSLFRPTLNRIQVMNRSQILHQMEGQRSSWELAFDCVGSR